MFWPDDVEGEGALARNGLCKAFVRFREGGAARMVVLNGSFAALQRCSVLAHALAARVTFGFRPRVGAGHLHSAL
eukprot:153645-Pleurochrysis_carterae.AAC.1